MDLVGVVGVAESKNRHRYHSCPHPFERVARVVLPNPRHSNRSKYHSIMIGHFQSHHANTHSLHHWYGCSAYSSNSPSNSNFLTSKTIFVNLLTLLTWHHSVHSWHLSYFVYLLDHGPGGILLWSKTHCSPMYSIQRNYYEHEVQ